MAEAPAVKPTNSTPSLRLVRLAGRIESARSKSSARGKLFFTLLKLPAEDAYSSPATVEVISSERLGGSGEEVSIIVRVGGYSRSYDAKDDDGQRSTVRTADNTLSFVEFA